jgi:hypothetical protein
MSALSKLKAIEHVLAVAGAAVAAFTMSPAGQALIHQYPILAPVAGALGFLIAFYHAPKTSA